MPGSLGIGGRRPPLLHKATPAAVAELIVPFGLERVAVGSSETSRDAAASDRVDVTAVSAPGRGIEWLLRERPTLNGPQACTRAVAKAACPVSAHGNHSEPMDHQLRDARSELQVYCASGTVAHGRGQHCSSPPRQLRTARPCLSFSKVRIGTFMSQPRQSVGKLPSRNECSMASRNGEFQASSRESRGNMPRRC